MADLCVADTCSFCKLQLVIHISIYLWYESQKRQNESLGFYMFLWLFICLYIFFKWFCGVYISNCCVLEKATFCEENLDAILVTEVPRFEAHVAWWKVVAPEPWLPVVSQILSKKLGRWMLKPYELLAKQISSNPKCWWLSRNLQLSTWSSVIWWSFCEDEDAARRFITFVDVAYDHKRFLGITVPWPTDPTQVSTTVSKTRPEPVRKTSSRSSSPNMEAVFKTVL